MKPAEAIFLILLLILRGALFGRPIFLSPKKGAKHLKIPEFLIHMSQNKLLKKAFQLLLEELELDEKDVEYINEYLGRLAVRPDYAEVFVELRDAACERHGEACDAAALLTVREALALALKLIDAAAEAAETERKIARTSP